MGHLLKSASGHLLKSPSGHLVMAGGSCCCCCRYSSDAIGCNANRTAASFTITDSGIVPCACIGCPTARTPFSQSWAVTGLSSTNCATLFGGGGGSNTVWTSPFFADATISYYSGSASCTGVPASTGTNSFAWQLWKSANLWELALGSNVNSYWLFYSAIAVTDPVNCCKGLTFANQLTVCGQGFNSPTIGNQAGIFCDGNNYGVGTGGVVICTPCCS